MWVFNFAHFSPMLQTSIKCTLYLIAQLDSNVPLLYTPKLVLFTSVELAGMKTEVKIKTPIQNPLFKSAL